MAAEAPPPSRTGDGWASPFGAATMQSFRDADEATHRSSNGVSPLTPTMHARRPSDPQATLEADFSGFTLLTRRSKSVTLPGSAAASREGSQHEALFASTVGDVRKEVSSPAADRGRTWNPFKRKAAAKKSGEDPLVKPVAPAGAVAASEGSASRRWGRSKGAAAAGAAGSAVKIDVKDAEPAAALASSAPVSPRAAASDRPASAPAGLKDAGGPPDSDGVSMKDGGEAAPDSAGANGGARWFGRSPAKAGPQPSAVQQPRAAPADVALRTSAATKPEAAGGSGRFGALFSGIQRTSMSRPASGKAAGKARAGDEALVVGRDSGEAATGEAWPASPSQEVEFCIEKDLTSTLVRLIAKDLMHGRRLGERQKLTGRVLVNSHPVGGRSSRW